MQSAWNKTERWLLPAVLILFLLEMLLLPMAVGLTYADRSDTPAHTLTYKKADLSWDRNTTVQANGTAELHLFDTIYDDTVISADNSNVIAPGTTLSEYVRLQNKVSGTISYTAILYQIEDGGDVPLEASLTGDGFRDSTRFTLPQGVNSTQVVRAVKGIVKGFQFQDFDINWIWRFEDEADLSAGDSIDTTLGNAEELADVTLGLYIVVEDNNSYYTSNPKTGDEFNIHAYSALMVFSGAVLALLLADRMQHRKKCEE